MLCENSPNSLPQNNNFNSLNTTAPYQSPSKSVRKSVPSEDSITTIKFADITATRSVTPEKYKNSLLASLTNCNSPLELVSEICAAQRRLLPNQALIFPSTHNHPPIFILPDATHFVKQNLLGGVQSTVYRTEEITRKNPLKRKYCIIKTSNDSYSPVKQIFKSNLPTDPRLDNMLANYSVLASNSTAVDSNRYAAVFESSDGDLSGVDFHRRTLPVKYIVNQLLDHAGGLVYLHNNGIIHRDIKGDNLLVNDRDLGKVTDWGLTKFDDTNQHKIEGTLFYIPPFTWKKLEDQLSAKREGYQGMEGDVFSFGRTIQYDAIMRVLGYLAKKHFVNISQLQAKIFPSTVTIENSTHLNELDAQHPFRIIITGQSANLTANIFPDHSQMLQDTLDAIELFKQHLSIYEFDRLVSLATLAYKLQTCSPTKLPKMSEVESELKMIASAAAQQGAIETDELIKPTQTENTCTLNGWAFKEQGPMFFYADDPEEAQQNPASSPSKLRKRPRHKLESDALAQDSIGSDDVLFGSSTLLKRSSPLDWKA